MSCQAYAAGYLVLVVARDGVCLYSPNLSALVGVHPWDLCWETEGRISLARHGNLHVCVENDGKFGLPLHGCEWAPGTHLGQ